METFLKKVDGYKTGTGIAILYIVGLIVTFYHGAGWSMPDWLMGLQEAAAYTGASLGVVGVGHKVVKGQITMEAFIKNQFPEIINDLNKEYELDQAVAELGATIDEEENRGI